MNFLNSNAFRTLLFCTVLVLSCYHALVDEYGRSTYYLVMALLIQLLHHIEVVNESLAERNSILKQVCDIVEANEAAEAAEAKNQTPTEENKKA